MLHFRRFKKIYYSAGLILLTVLVGIVGYMVIEHYRFFDAFYMTIITVGTVGFQEVHPLSDPGRLFTALLIVMSFGTFANAIITISRTLVDGEFNKYFKDLRLNST